MTRALSILFVFIVAFCCNTEAAERITATITVTNTPGTTNSLTINGSFRYWTNASSLGTIQTNLTGKNAATTNLYNQIASYPYSGGVILRWADTNQIQLIGSLGGAMAGSIGGTWATLTLSTQSGPQTYTALWPMENIVGATNRTNQGSALVAGLSNYSTNAFATNATALSNYLSKGASALQKVTSPVQFDGGLRGATVALTNGVIDGVTLTNARIQMSQLTSTNDRIWFTNSAGAINSASYLTPDTNGVISLRNRSDLTLDPVDDFGILNLDNVLNVQMGLGVFPRLNTNYSATLGGVANTWNYGNVFQNSNNVFQQGFVSTNALDVTPVVLNPDIRGSTSTNATFRGTNIINGRIDATPRANSSLANGYNSAVVFGTNLWVEFSGPSAAYTNAGFAAPGGPQLVWGQFDNPGLSFTILNESGIEATAANRVTTETGGLLNSTNRTVFVGFKYDTTTSRWRVISFR